MPHKIQPKERKSERGRLSTVLVFKTNVNGNRDRAFIGAVLDRVPGISEWSLDLSDSDRVLRVVGDGLEAQTIIRLLNHHHYRCEILP